MKLKTIQVPVFKKGQFVKLIEGSRVGKVVSQSGVHTKLIYMGNGSSTSVTICTQLQLITAAEYAKAMPKKLSGGILGYTTTIENNQLKIGCKSLNKADSLRLAAFIVKNMG